MAAERIETILLLHGIARTGKSMARVQARLEKEGYKTLNITYPSTKLSIDHIVDWLADHYLTPAFLNQPGKIHFVTHSMGGLAIRRFLNKHHVSNLGRVVMLGPPHSGSEVADFLQHFWLYKAYYGPAGQELTTLVQKDTGENIDYEIGIIAGTRRWFYPASFFLIPGPSDGRVSVERTKLHGMKDHICIKASHTFMMNHPKVQAQIIYFLKEGRFLRD